MSTICGSVAGALYEDAKDIATDLFTSDPMTPAEIAQLCAGKLELLTPSITEMVRTALWKRGVCGRIGVSAAGKALIQAYYADRAISPTAASTKKPESFVRYRHPVAALAGGVAVLGTIGFFVYRGLR